MAEGTGGLCGEEGGPDGKTARAEAGQGAEAVMEKEGATAVSVERISPEGMSDRGEMGADLVSASAVDAAACQRQRVGVGWLPCCHGKGEALCPGEAEKHLHGGVTEGVPLPGQNPYPSPSGRVYGAAHGEIVVWMARNEGEITFVDAAFGCGAAPASFASGVEGGQHKAGCTDVEAVEQQGEGPVPGGLGSGRVFKEAFKQGFKARSSASGQSDTVQPCRLVQCGETVRSMNQACVSVPVRSSGQGFRQKGKGLTGPYPDRGAHGPAVQKHTARKAQTPPPAQTKSRLQSLQNMIHAPAVLCRSHRQMKHRAVHGISADRDSACFS